jgi:hypothetical protein
MHTVKVKLMLLSLIVPGTVHALHIMTLLILTIFLLHRYY